jgi:hypothetical protein
VNFIGTDLAWGERGGMHGAIIKATKTSEPESKGLPVAV